MPPEKIYPIVLRGLLGCSLGYFAESTVTTQGQGWAQDTWGSFRRRLVVAPCYLAHKPTTEKSSCSMRTGVTSAAQARGMEKAKGSWVVTITR